MWLHQKTNGLYPAFNKNVTRKWVQWDMLAVGSVAGIGPAQRVLKLFTSTQSVISTWPIDTNYGSYDDEYVYWLRGTGTVNDIDFDDDGNVFLGITTAGAGDRNAFLKLNSVDSSIMQQINFLGTTQSVSMAVFNSDNFYLGTNRGLIYKHTSSTNTVVWSATASSSNIYNCYVAVDASGDVYISSEDQRLKKLNSGGTFVWEFASSGNPILGVHVDSTNVYTYGEWNSTSVTWSTSGFIRMYDTNGNGVRQFGSVAGANDEVVDLDTYGNLIACATNRNVVQIYNKNTYGLSYSIATTYSEVYKSVSFDRFGKLYVSERGVIKVYDTDYTTVLRTITIPSYITKMKAEYTY